MIFVLKRGADEKAMYELIQKLKLWRKERKINILKYCGAIKLEEDPMEIQKQMRDEWE